MRTIFTWNSLKLFLLFYLLVLGFTALVSVLDSGFDLDTQVSTKNLLFNIITAAFITLIRIAWQERHGHQEIKSLNLQDEPGL